MKRLFVISVTGLLLSGCYGNAEKFSQRFARLSCVNAKECESKAFEKEWDSVNECRDEVKDLYNDLFADCEYDAKQGRKCIREMYKARKDCDWEEKELPECDEVFTCMGELDDLDARSLELIQQLPVEIQDQLLWRQESF